MFFVGVRSPVSSSLQRDLHPDADPHGQGIQHHTGPSAADNHHPHHQLLHPLHHRLLHSLHLGGTGQWVAHAFFFFFFFFNLLRIFPIVDSGRFPRGKPAATVTLPNLS